MTSMLVMMYVGVRSYVVNSTFTALKEKAQVVSLHLVSLKKPVSIKALISPLAQATQSRITLILLDGTVIVDSHEDASVMDNHLSRPEIQSVLQSNTEAPFMIRYSDTLQKNMMYYSIQAKSPMNDFGEFIFIRVAVPFSLMVIHNNALMGWILGVFLFVLLTSVPLVYITAKKMTLPLLKLTESIERYSHDQEFVPFPEAKTHEVKMVSTAFEKMRTQLDAKIAHLSHERQQTEAILKTMREGILCIDRKGAIHVINDRAKTLLELDPTVITKGHHVDQLFENYPELMTFFKRLILQQVFIEEDIIFEGNVQKYIHVSGAPIQQKDSQDLVLILSDITTIKQLEETRKKFVANVSHELKTPITTIKSAVETILGLDDEDKGHRDQFMAIVSRHSERMDTIIDDLLQLSKLEVDPDGIHLVTSDQDLSLCIQNAIDVLYYKSEKAGVKITFKAKELRYNHNPELLEQAVKNLIDNAIKYTTPENGVSVYLSEESEEITIQVQDFGAGIEARHLPQLFHRFYRVDNARSRQLGGTGLGLAIVKHISQVHGGYVSVTSELEKGSLFTIHLPK